MSKELVPDQAAERAFVSEIEKLMRAAAEAKDSQFSHVNIPVQHVNWGGIYARTIFIPQGAIITGHIHKYRNLNLLVFGELELRVNGQVNRVVGPTWLPSEPGIKRMARALTPAVWTTFHATEETNPQVIERLFIAKTEEEYQQFLALQQAEPDKKWLG